MKVAEVFVKDPEWPNESRGILFLEDNKLVVRLNRFPDKVLLMRRDVILSVNEIRKWSKKSRKALYKKIPVLKIRTKKGIYEISFPSDNGSEERDKVINWLEEKLSIQNEQAKEKTN